MPGDPRVRAASEADVATITATCCAAVLDADGHDVRHGYKHGRRRDVVLLQRTLGAVATAPLAERQKDHGHG